jgi:hypothetical protein
MVSMVLVKGDTTSPHSMMKLECLRCTGSRILIVVTVGAGRVMGAVQSEPILQSGVEGAADGVRELRVISGLEERRLVRERRSGT